MNHAFLKVIMFAGLIATQVNIISAQARTLSTNANWTWMKGTSITNQPGTYGTQGVADSANTPGARAGAVSWRDNSGNLWLFGGRGNAISNTDCPLNDLWKYDRTTTNWTWMKGANTNNQPGIYGTQGVPDPANTPGARLGAISWTNSSGALWLFGGYGYDVSGNYGYLNDLWKYDPATTNWTWMHGSTDWDQYGTYGTQGVPYSANVPGARYYAVSWVDNAGALWLFGGYGCDASSSGFFGYLNDLWKYDPATMNWTWMHGSTNRDQTGAYSTQGVPDAANTPGSRYVAVSWVDNAGALWLFGGYGYDALVDVLTFGFLNDLWKYDPAAMNWTWIKGSTNCNQAGTYGAQGVPAAANMPGARFVAMSWVDNAGALWLFGGRGYASTGSWGELNDLWKYDTVTADWAWMKGSTMTNQPGSYGTQGKADPANMPHARNGAVSWTDNMGALWLFGGGYNNIGFGWVILNDLWKYVPVANSINDYDGDGKSDLAVYRAGYWSIYSLANGLILNNGGAWGGADALPVPGDYDGDGKSDLAVYSNGYWSIYSLANGIILNNEGVWGGPGWTPVR